MKHTIDTRQLACKLEVKLGEAGSFEGYGSVFDVLDNQSDIIVPGAFTHSLAEAREVRLLWQHEMDKEIGRFTSLAEDAKGLFVRGQLDLASPLGKMAYEALRQGEIGGLSIGYVVRASYPDEARGVRVITEVELWEVSFVTFPANPHATVTQFKGAQSIREFEHFLRNSGYSRQDAKRIASKGFGKGADDEALLRLGMEIERGIGVLLG
jgi:HK97 family phage prohead protease